MTALPTVLFYIFVLLILTNLTFILQDNGFKNVTLDDVDVQAKK